MSAALITSFYEAFTQRDAEAMVASYADDVRFSDPVFPDLRGDRAKSMWRMLCQLGVDLEITFRDVAVSGDRGAAHWEARYTFSATGRRVHNVIDARFTLASGKIVEHVDTFDLWRWSGMALGLPGALFGWTPMLKGTIRKNAARSLDRWIAKR